MAKKKEIKKIEDDVKKVIKQLEKVLQNVFEKNENTRLLKPWISGISLDITLEPCEEFYEEFDDKNLQDMFKDFGNKRFSLDDFIDENNEISDFSKFKEILQEWIRKIEDKTEEKDNRGNYEDYEDCGEFHNDALADSNEYAKVSSEREEDTENKKKKKVKILKELYNLERTIEIFKDSEKVYVTADFPNLKKEDFKIVPYSKEVRIETKIGRNKTVKNLRLPVKINPNSMKINYRNGIIDVEFTRAHRIRRKEKEKREEQGC